MNPLSENIINNSYTKKQAIRRLHTLKNFIDFMLFKDEGSQGIESALKRYPQDASKQEDMAWLSQLDTKLLTGIDQKKAKELLTQIEELIEKSQSVVIYLPIPLAEDPTQSGVGVISGVSSVDLQVNAIDQIGTWVKKTLSQSALFELRFDADLIGGCALSFKGIYKDYSLKTKIEENKNEILKNLMSLKKN